MMMKKEARNICLVLITLFGMANQLIAQDVAVTTFEGPKAIKRVNPNYPMKALNKGEEGWVELNMMIDESGKPFEVMVLNSAGNSEFKAAAAVNAISEWQYEPAKSDGKAIASSVRTVLRFALLTDGAESKASSRFVKAYTAFKYAPKNQSQEGMKKLLTRLEESGGTNRYELAFLNLAKFIYAEKYGTATEQIKFLDAALSFTRDKNDEAYLAKADVRAGKRGLMKLQVNNGYYQDALDTYHYFELTEDQESLELFKLSIDQIKVFEQNDQKSEIPVVLDENGSFNFKLLKHKVYASGVQGKLSEFHVLCEKKYVGFPAEADVSYDIPKIWGQCSLAIIGDAGTTLTLVQE